MVQLNNHLIYAMYTFAIINLKKFRDSRIDLVGIIEHSFHFDTEIYFCCWYILECNTIYLWLQFLIFFLQFIHCIWLNLQANMHMKYFLQDSLESAEKFIFNLLENVPFYFTKYSKRSALIILILFMLFFEVT